MDDGRQVDQELREPTPAEALVAASLGVDEHWYPAWLGSGFTPAEVAEWYPTTSSCRSGSPAAAVRLSSAGWSPADVRAAIAAVETGRAYCTASDVETATREAVLWQEVGEHYRSRLRRAEQLRTTALQAAQALGAGPATLGRRLGLTPRVVAGLIGRGWRTPGH